MAGVVALCGEQCRKAPLRHNGDCTFWLFSQQMKGLYRCNHRTSVKPVSALLQGDNGYVLYR